MIQRSIARQRDYIHSFHANVWLTDIVGDICLSFPSAGRDSARENRPIDHNTETESARAPKDANARFRINHKPFNNIILTVNSSSSNRKKINSRIVLTVFHDSSVSDATKIYFLEPHRFTPVSKTLNWILPTY